MQLEVNGRASLCIQKSRAGFALARMHPSELEVTSVRFRIKGVA